MAISKNKLSLTHIDKETAFTTVVFKCANLKTVLKTNNSKQYRGAGKSLARTGRKQAQNHAKDVHNLKKNRDVSCHQVSFPAKQGIRGNSGHSDRNISLFPSWLG